MHHFPSSCRLSDFSRFCASHPQLTNPTLAAWKLSESEESYRKFTYFSFFFGFHIPIFAFPPLPLLHQNFLNFSSHLSHFPLTFLIFTLFFSYYVKLSSFFTQLFLSFLKVFLSFPLTFLSFLIKFLISPHNFPHFSWNLPQFVLINFLFTSFCLKML